jgi:pyruvate/oxaloacetate carboxyltransferase
MKKAVFILASILLIGALILWVSQTPYPKPVTYKKIPLSDRNLIWTTTEWSYLDTIVSVGMDELGIKDMEVLIQHMDERIKSKFEEGSDDVQLKAYVSQWLRGYVISVAVDLGRDDAIDIMSHELIHLVQYEDSSLVVGEGTEVIWGGARYDILHTPYNERPWERAAFRKQKELADKIRAKIIE